MGLPAQLVCRSLLPSPSLSLTCSRRRGVWQRLIRMRTWTRCMRGSGTSSPRLRAMWQLVGVHAPFHMLPVCPFLLLFSCLLAPLMKHCVHEQPCDTPALGFSLERLNNCSCASGACVFQTRCKPSYSNCRSHRGVKRPQPLNGAAGSKHDDEGQGGTRCVRVVEEGQAYRAQSSCAK